MSSVSRKEVSIKTRMVVSVILTLCITLSAGLFFYNQFISKKLSDSYYRSVQLLSHSFSEGVQSSLERGQMKNFHRLLSRQTEIAGVEEVVLYNINGLLDMSATGKLKKGSNIDSDIWRDIREKQKTLMRTENQAIHIYTPQVIVSDCLRCHPGWPDNGIGGVLELVYDIKPLRSTISNQRAMLFGGGFVLLLIASIVIFILTGSLTRPLVKMTAVMKKIAANDLEVEIPAKERHDEIGHMAAAVEIFKENALERHRLEQALSEMANRFEESVVAFFTTFTKDMSLMQESVQQMKEVADQTTSRAQAAVAISSETVTNVNQVATAIEELVASIEEIQGKVASSSEISHEATEKAAVASSLGDSLATSASEIDKVVDLIAGIAGQTNLLALNATIEAARAGEAGRGFAVVATEVKGLAAKTTTSTKEVTDKITEIQNFTKDSVRAVSDIDATIATINETMALVLSAVDEQRDTTAEITESTRQALTHTEDVASDLDGVASAIAETDAALEQVLEKVDNLMAGGKTLRGEVDRFLEQVRAM